MRSLSKVIVIFVLLLINLTGVVFLVYGETFLIPKSNFTEIKFNDIEKHNIEKIKQINTDVTRMIHFNDRSLVVVQSQDNKEYLSIDIEKDKDKMGTLFQTKEINEESLNIVIYGHSSSKNNTRLTPLKNTRYVKANSLFTVTDKQQDTKYQIIAYLNVDLDNLHLPFYRANWRTKSEFIDYLKKANKESIIEFSIENLEEVEKCLTLVTCDLRKKSQRWIVIAIPIYHS